MTARIVTALAAATSLVVGAPARAATDPSDPCAIVSKADVAAAIGAPVTSVKGNTAGPSRGCRSPAEAHARFIDIVKQTASAASMPATKLTGVGDEAVAIFSSVYVRKGNAALVFNIFGVRGPALTARAVALAKHTLPRLH